MRRGFKENDMSISGAIFFSAFLAVFFGWLSSQAESFWKLWLGFFVFTDGLTWFIYVCSVMADQQ